MSPGGALLIHEGVPGAGSSGGGQHAPPLSASLFLPLTPDFPSLRKRCSFDSSLTYRQAAGVRAGPGSVVLSVVLGALGVPAVSWALPMSLAVTMTAPT